MQALTYSDNIQILTYSGNIAVIKESLNDQPDLQKALAQLSEWTPYKTIEDLRKASTSSLSLVIWPILTKPSYKKILQAIETLRQEREMPYLPILFLAPSKYLSSIIRNLSHLDCVDFDLWPVCVESVLHRAKGQLKSAQLYRCFLTEKSLRNQSEERLEQLSHQDDITGLSNKKQYLSYMNGLLARARRRKGCASSIVIDLAHFQKVNQSYGHVTGDTILRLVAGRLQESLRPGDLVARLSGDEFVLALDDISKPQDAGKVANKILKALSQSYDVDGQEIFLGASIGVSIYPQDGSTPEELLQSADTAKNYAKQQGRNNYQFFRKSLHEESIQRIALEADLQHALELNEFEMYYQPKVDGQTFEITGFESLMRWNHKHSQMISPAIFIPIAEETRLIHAMGEWALRTSCVQNQQWIKSHKRDLSIAVNISMLQLKQAGFVETLLQSLEQSGLSPSQLELELTESMIMDNPEQAISILEQVHQHGVKIAIDDFGTGYSSLAYLKRLPIHTLKIDRSFVMDIEAHTHDAAIVEAIIHMAHSLDIVVVAEGVETQKQAEFLQSKKCDILQGYYFSRPQSASDIETLFEQQVTTLPSSK